MISTTRPNSYNVPSSRYRTDIRQSDRRGYSHSMTYKQKLYLYSCSCFYCGDYYPLGKLMGTDRFDNNKGYHDDNGVPSCDFCNTAKHVHGIQVYNDKIQKMAQMADGMMERKIKLEDILFVKN